MDLAQLCHTDWPQFIVKKVYLFLDIFTENSFITYSNPTRYWLATKGNTDWFFSGHFHYILPIIDRQQKALQIDLSLDIFRENNFITSYEWLKAKFLTIFVIAYPSNTKKKILCRVYFYPKLVKPVYPLPIGWQQKTL